MPSLPLWLYRRQRWHSRRTCRTPRRSTSSWPPSCSSATGTPASRWVRQLLWAGQGPWVGGFDGSVPATADPRRRGRSRAWQPAALASLPQQLVAPSIKAFISPHFVCSAGCAAPGGAGSGHGGGRSGGRGSRLPRLCPAMPGLPGRSSQVRGRAARVACGGTILRTAASLAGVCGPVQRKPPLPTLAAAAVPFLVQALRMPRLLVLPCVPLPTAPSAALPRMRPRCRYGVAAAPAAERDWAGCRHFYLLASRAYPEGEGGGRVAYEWGDGLGGWVAVGAARAWASMPCGSLPAAAGVHVCVFVCGCVDGRRLVAVVRVRVLALV